MNFSYAVDWNEFKTWTSIGGCKKFHFQSATLTIMLYLWNTWNTLNTAIKKITDEQTLDMLRHYILLFGNTVYVMWGGNKKNLQMTCVLSWILSPICLCFVLWKLHSLLLFLKTCSKFSRSGVVRVVSISKHRSQVLRLMNNLLNGCHNNTSKL